MKKHPSETQKYSKEVQVILNKKPSFLVRNGILLLVILFAILLVVSHFITYPDRLAAPITFEKSEIAGSGERFTGRIVLSADAASLVKPGFPVEMKVRQPGDSLWVTLDGVIVTLQPDEGGTYYIVYVKPGSGTIFPGYEGTAFILISQSNLLSKILNPILAIFRYD